MNHHLIKDTVNCLYCGKNTKEKKWFSEWNKDHHYKCFECADCGRKNHLRVKFNGSGHDDCSDLEKKLC